MKITFLATATPARLTSVNAFTRLGILGAALAVCASGDAQSILGSTASYALMAGSTVTNNGATTLTGNLGASGFPGSGGYALTGTQISPITATNQSDFTRAFDGLAAMSPTTDLTGLTLGTSAGATVLTPGIYHFASTAQLTGTLILDAQNQSGVVWVFQVGTTLTSAAGAAVTFANLATNSAATDGLFWQIGTTTTLGANTSFEGNMLGGTTFDFGTGAAINHGRALTGTGAITLAGNSIDFVGASSGYVGGLAFTGAGSSISAIPEPSTYALLAGVISLGAVMVRRRLRSRLAIACQAP